MTREEFINWFEERFTLNENNIYEFGQLYDEVTKPHWISVDEELPTKAEFYLCVIDDTIQVLFYNEGLEEWYEFYVTKEEHLDCEDWTKKVTHWMPLPAPPKKGGEDE